MRKTYNKDVQLLMTILKNQSKIKEAIKDFKCSERDIDEHKYAFDLCALYMSQIGEAAKSLTDATKDSFQYFSPSITYKFRNLIDHEYEKINKKALKAYIFAMIKPEVTKELSDRVLFCREHAKIK